MNNQNNFFLHPLHWLATLALSYSSFKLINWLKTVVIVVEPLIEKVIMKKWMRSQRWEGERSFKFRRRGKLAQPTKYRNAKNVINNSFPTSSKEVRDTFCVRPEYSLSQNFIACYYLGTINWKRKSRSFPIFRLLKPELFHGLSFDLLTSTRLIYLSKCTNMHDSEMCKSPCCPSSENIGNWSLTLIDQSKLMFQLGHDLNTISHLRYLNPSISINTQFYQLINDFARI